MAKSIKLRPHRVLIKAPRELVYQKMSSFGRGRLQGGPNESSKVLCRDNDSLIVEFNTHAGPFTYVSIEQITLTPPERISFRHLSGPLHFAQEEFLFGEADGDTELVHTGEIIWSTFPFFGWFGGVVYTRPVFERTVAKHMEQIKVSCEARAARSHVFHRREDNTASAPE